MKRNPTEAAACAADWVDPGWWFSGNSIQREAARAVCASCPLAPDCLDLALTAERKVPARYRHGIYAGTSGVERWRIATGREPRPHPITPPPLTGAGIGTGARRALR